MQNLLHLKQTDAFIDLPTATSGLKLVATDPETQHAFVVSHPDNALIHLDIAANNIIGEYLLQNEEGKPYHFIGIQFLSDTKSVCLAAKSGDILLVDVFGSKKEECVGTVETGLTAMAWSPDFEIVVFTTAADTLLLMTQDWDVISEQPTIPDSEKNKPAPKPKPAPALSSPVVPAPVIPAIPLTVTTPTISWRGDGAYFAVSSVENGGGVFRVWERSGAFHSKSDQPIANQGTLLAWKPSGETIATTQNLGDGKQEIIFFERNGLRHYEFRLYDLNAQVLDLKWNAGSDILAILIKLSTEVTVVQLWTTKNYHWYLKQELIPPVNCDSPVPCSYTGLYWDVEQQHLLTCVSHQGHVRQFEVAWDVDISQGLASASNESLAAVIDGAKLLLTPFKRVVIPPPMSAVELNLDTIGKISRVDFEASTNRIVTKHANGSLSFFNAYSPSVEPNKPPRNNIAPTLFASLKPGVKDVNDLINARQLSWITPSSLLGVVSHPGAEMLVQFDLAFDADSKTATIARKVSTPVPDNRALRLIQNKDSASIYLQLDDGSVLTYAPASSTHLASLTPQPLSHLPTPCHWLASVTLVDEEVLVGLSSRSKLYVNNTLVAGDCNSFAIHSEFLIYTTVSHTLRCFYLSKSVEENLVLLNTKRQYNETIREVEQGSHIISVVPADTRLILQMPRGNLETIEPRSLVVSKIRKLIDLKQYLAAFSIARKNRIDLNLLYDHKPTQFMDNLDLFVSQLDSVEFINLFISSLQKEDVTKTMFIPATAKESQEEAIKAKLKPFKIVKGAAPVVNKITTICDAMIAVFKKQADKDKYLLCTLTSLVKRDPPQIDEALKFVQRLRGEERVAEIEVGKPSAPSASNLTAEKALKYLVFLVDVNALYNIALGMYDFDLVLMVAQKSQKDPREYLPFLAALQEQEPFYQRHSIDKHLGRFESALANLSEAQPFEKHADQIKALIEEKKLYSYAIALFEKKPERKELLGEVLDLYAEHLMANKHYGQAALAWRRANMLQEALNAYKLHGDWRSVIGLAYQLQMPPTEIIELAKQMAVHLAAIYQYEDAGYLYENYCASPTDAVSVYLSGQLWDQALLTCHKHGLSGRIADELVPAIEDAADTIHREVNETMLRFIKYHNRLLLVRANKYLQSKIVHAPVIEGSEAGSFYTASEASSSDGETASESSKASSFRGGRGGRGGKKGKPQRRQNKSKRHAAGAKKGSPMEEFYLLAELRSMVPAPKLQDEVKYLLRFLVLFDRREKAQALQKVLADFLKTVTGALPLINSAPISKLDEDEEEEAAEAAASAATGPGKKPKDELLDAIFNPIAFDTAKVSQTVWKLDLL